MSFSLAIFKLLHMWSRGVVKRNAIKLILQMHWRTSAWVQVADYANNFQALTGLDTWPAVAFVNSERHHMSHLGWALSLQHITVTFQAYMWLLEVNVFIGEIFTFFIFNGNTACQHFPNVSVIQFELLLSYHCSKLLARKTTRGLSLWTIWQLLTQDMKSTPLLNNVFKIQLLT